MSKGRVMKVNCPSAFYFRINIFMRYLKLIMIVKRKQNILMYFFVFVKALLKKCSITSPQLLKNSGSNIFEVLQ